MSRYLLSLVALCCAAPLHAEESPIRVVDNGKAIEVRGLSADDRAALTALKADSDLWRAILLVCIDRKESNRIPMFGVYTVVGDALRFTPRFPLTRGVTYRVVFAPAKIPGRPSTKAIESTVLIPKPPQNPTTTVVQIYPTADKLPENQLKFYLHFSAPMERGDSYRHISLLDERGKKIENTFLELEQELWDYDTKRFTLYFDPGRIKQGLKPREDLGPILEAGKRYTLVVDRTWEDADGNPLKESFRKSFSVGPGEEKQIDPKKWTLTPPNAGDNSALTVVSPKSLEQALFSRVLWVEDERGRKIDGTVVVDEHEKRWRFTPKEAWQAGAYRLVADTRLEDLAGNSIARPFEVDVFRPVEREIKTETIALPFAVKRK